jgi:DNA-binding MarR family transcriptional regulator
MATIPVMTTRALKAPASPAAGAVRWLDDDEEATWRAFATATIKLQGALENQLKRDADLSYTEYHALARLSEDPRHTLRMSELAGLTDASLSRLSHLVTRLEDRGFLRREPDPTDGRFTNAVLTPRGFRKLVASAPAHVAEVRLLLIDELRPPELRVLRELSERIVARIEGSGAAGPDLPS